jgi:hypothetical protein
MAAVEEMRNELMHVLGDCERWLDTLGDLPSVPPDIEGVAADIDHLRGQRTRTLSTLLNVGLLGRQSSGKSFLINGLQGGLEYFPITDEDGSQADEYLGILPTSANPTTACPSTVAPVENDPSVSASGRGLLRVKFAGSEWIEIGADLPPSVVAAYGSAEGNVTDRNREHINRHVEAVELLISDFRLQVKFFDLPGSESPIEEHELIMRKAWGEVDCFIYVSQATSALTVNELDLMRDLYEHHLKTGKRVLWALTGIDRATQREHGQAAWRSVLTTNNAYLQSHFPNPDGALGMFIDGGFLPVSAAWEAQADFLEAKNSAATALRRRSGMSILRDQLQELIDSGAGHRHLALVADEARWLIRRRQRTISDTLAAHQVSVGELADQQTSVGERLTRAASLTRSIDTQLHEELDRRVRNVERLFKDLADMLHGGLDELIDAGPLSAEHAHQIDVRQAQLFAEWMTAPNGPATAWERELKEFDAISRTRLRLELGEDTAGARLVSPGSLDTSRFLVQTNGNHSIGIYGLIQTAAATVGVAGPIAGGAVWLMTSLSLTFIAVPVGAAVLAAISIAKLTDVIKDRETQIRKARNERKRMLDGLADQARASFTEVAHGQGQLLIDAVGAHLAQYQDRLGSTLVQILERIESKDIARSREIIARLTPVDQAGRQIITALQGLAIS